MKNAKLALAGMALAAVLAPAAASAQDRVQTGVLHCEVAPSVSYIVGSQKGLHCVYRPVGKRDRERYDGVVTRVGPDVGFTTGGKLTWAVYAPARHKVGALIGSYGGASASATVGVGVSANVLVGGNNNTVTLQPISIGTQTGLDAALSVTGLELRGGRR